MTNDISTTTRGQCSLSYEVLCLLHWLVENDADALKDIIKKALASGLRRDLQQIDHTSDFIGDDIQESVIEFFALLESLLLESINEHAEQKAREKNLLPAIDQIDTTVCDDATVRFSLARVTTSLEHNPNVNAKDQLFKEILKHWQPHSETLVN